MKKPKKNYLKKDFLKSEVQQEKEDKMNGINLESIIAKTQPVILPEKFCQICKVSEGGYNYVAVATNRNINSCFECRWISLDWLEKECIACKKWLFGAKETYERTCSLDCEQRYQKSLEQERILYGRIGRNIIK